jgi:transposase
VDVSNVLKEEKKQQVIALGRLGWSLRRIQKSTGVRRETAAAYLREAGVALRPPGVGGRAAPSKPANEVTPDLAAVPTSNGDSAVPLSAKPANEVTPDSGVESWRRTEPAPEPQARSSPSASTCEPYREAIGLALSRGRNAKAIWQDLVDTHGFAGGYQSVKRFVRQCRGTPTPEACAVIETVPGEESQVDYGTGPMVRDFPGGKYRRTRLFVLTLGYSRKSVRLLVFRSSSQVWTELHEKAFRRLGGVTRVVVLDNLREGVLRPDIYAPTLHPLYHDVLAHYGSVALPLSRSLGRALGRHADSWHHQTASGGPVRPKIGRPCCRCRSSLSAITKYGQRTVHLDGCVEVEAAYYGAPPGWIGRQVQVQWDLRHVRLLHPQTGELLREHLRQARGGHRIQDQDRPQHTPRGTQQLLLRADRTGARIGALCRGMHEEQRESLRCAAF